MISWNLKSGIAALYIILCSVHGVAQVSDADQDAVLSMFDHPEDVQWVQEYVAYFDVLHSATIVLATDGSAYRGWCKLTSGTTFDLVGAADAGKEYVELEEIDQNGLVTGHLVINVSQDRLHGSWWSRDRARSVNVQAVSTRLVELRRFEPRFTILKGELGTEQLFLSLAQESTDVQDGMGLLGTRLFDVLGTCSMYCDTIELYIQDVLPGKLILRKTHRDTFAVRLEHIDGSVIRGQAIVTWDCPLQSVAWADYHMKVEAAYPRTGNLAFDMWMADVFSRWSSETKNALELTRKEGPSGRWSGLASGWVDVTLCSDRVISGVLTMYATSEKKYYRRAFAFDLKANKHVDVQSFARRGTDIVTHVQDLARAGILQQEMKGSDGFIDWASQAQFTCAGLSENGLIVFSEFNPEYGDLQAYIPFDQLEDILKVKALTRQL